MVKSDLLIGVKLKHVLTMGDKSPGIRTPLYKETNIVPNDCCRICRIYVKISGRSKINVSGYNNKDFSQKLSSVLSADVHADDSTGLSQIICQRCQREVVMFARVLEQGKELDKFRAKYNEAIKNQLAEYQLKRQKHCVKDSPLLDRQTKKSAWPDPPTIVRRTLIPRQGTQKENFQPWPFSSCDLLFDGSQETRKAAVTRVG